jgi:hypothetical protein
MDDTNAGGTRGQMPGGQGDPGLPMFPSSNAAPGTPPPPSWEPGIVEVQFREGVRPEVQATRADAPPQISSPADADMTPLNRILSEYQLREAAPTFEQTPAESATEAQTIAQQRGIEVPNLHHFVTLRFPSDAEVQRIAQELNQLEDVERAAPVPRAAPPQSPLNEPRVGTGDQVVVDSATGLENQWYIYRCRANSAWGMSSGGGVVIADIDWGYRTTHQDLAPRLDLSHAYNSFDGGTNVSHGTSVTHGTGVLGIAGSADNDLGMAGFGFGATLWPIQANSGPGTALAGDSWARAIDWVRTTNSGGRRKVIILEVQSGALGNYEQVLSVNAAIRTAIANGVVVCVAAGNGDRDAGLDDSGNPIQETGSILVGATAYNATQNQRAGFSNYGARITVSAPGDPSHDLTCSNTSDTTYMNGFGGTSGATPKVAGTAALMLAADPSLTHQEIRTILRDTGSAVTTDSAKPVGTFLNCEAAVRAARSNGPIIVKHTGKVLDVRGVSTANGAQIQQWDHHGGDNQLFRLIPVGGGYYKIVVEHSGKVLDVRGISTANGAEIQQWDWWGGDNQRWRLEPLGDGYYRVVAKHSGRVLDVRGISTANGAQIQQWDWLGGDNQRWKL